MAYSGWLLKIGNYTVPMSFMKPETYSPYVNMQDCIGNGRIVESWTERKIS